MGVACKAELTARLAETSGLQSQLDAALLQLAAANEQLATQNAALQARRMSWGGAT